MPIITKQDVTKRAGASPGLEVYDLVDAAQGSQSLRIGALTIAPNTRLPHHIHPANLPLLSSEPGSICIKRLEEGKSYDDYGTARQ